MAIESSWIFPLKMVYIMELSKVMVGTQPLQLPALIKSKPPPWHSFGRCSPTLLAFEWVFHGVLMWI
jgi:hypothetical protein